MTDPAGGGRPDCDPPDREAGLWRAWKTSGRLDARQALFEAYIPLARKIAARQYDAQRRSDLELSDLRQLAYAGLLEAIDRFDPQIGAPFAAFAGKRINGSVLDGVARMSELRQQSSFRNRMRYERARSLSEPHAGAEAGASLVQAVSDIAAGLALGFMLEAANLAANTGDVDSAPGPYESLAMADLMRRALCEMDALPDRERAVIRHHYLDGLGFEEVSRLLGVTKGRVSQIHRQAIDTLKRRLLRAGLSTLQP